MSAKTPSTGGGVRGWRLALQQCRWPARPGASDIVTESMLLQVLYIYGCRPVWRWQMRHMPGGLPAFQQDIASCSVLTSTSAAPLLCSPLLIRPDSRDMLQVRSLSGCLATSCL